MEPEVKSMKCKTENWSRNHVLAQCDVKNRKYAKSLRVNRSNPQSELHTWTKKRKKVMTPLGHPAQIASTNHDECFSTMSEVFSSSKNQVPHSSLMFVRQVRLLPYWAMALLSKRFSPPLDEKAGTCKHKVYSEKNFQVRSPLCTFYMATN